jgi:hypothetical protein
MQRLLRRCRRENHPAWSTHLPAVDSILAAPGRLKACVIPGNLRNSNLNLDI